MLKQCVEAVIFTLHSEEILGVCLDATTNHKKTLSTAVGPTPTGAYGIGPDVSGDH